MSVREVLFRELVRDVPSTTYATHGLYMYPAKFIPQVVRYVINNYTEPGDWLFDPFAGYGTVAIEASLTGRNAVLWDLNPITDLLVKASTYTGELRLEDFEVDWDYGSPYVPAWGNIAYWHPREFLNVLSRAWGYWHREVKPELKPLVAIPLLKVTRYFSYSDEKIAKLYRSKYAEEKVKHLLSTDWRNKLVSMYWEHAREVYRKVREYQALGPRKVELVVEASRPGNIVDATSRRLGMDVDVLITSPPYLQAQEYIRSFKLELAWLGYSGDFISTLSKREIPYNAPPNVEVRSGLYREFRGRVRGLDHEKLLTLYDTYFKSLASFLNNNHGRVRKYMAIFVGPVKIRNLRVPIDEILREHLESLGWVHVETLVDRIVARRLFKTETNPATGLEDERTPTEHLLIMKRRN